MACVRMAISFERDMEAIRKIQAGQHKMGKHDNKFFEYKGKIYPDYIRRGNAIKFAMPYIEYYLKGCKNVVDIGGTKEWHYPGATCVNVENKDGYHAMKLPDKKFDGLVSSHTLEHLQNPRHALELWSNHLEEGSPMFIYLPHVKMRYWASDNPRHLQCLDPTLIEYWMQDLGFKNIIKTDQDGYFSFWVVGIKDDK